MDTQKDKTIDQKFDEIQATELTKRLKRQPSIAELSNMDNDADLVNETLWQLIKGMDTELQELRKKVEQLEKTMV